MADEQTPQVEQGSATVLTVREVESVAKVAPETTEAAAVSAAAAFNPLGFWRDITRAAEKPDVVLTAADYPRAGPLAGVAASVDNYFLISHRKSSFYLEFTGGMTTFFAMCYIMALNGIILDGSGISKQASFFSTALSSGIFTTLMGLLVNLPIALAPGMGLNGYFAAVTKSGKLDYQDALGAVFISGIFYLFLTFTGMRAYLFQAVPKYLRAAITVGIGFFICMIGMKIGEITAIVLNVPAQFSIPDSVGNAYATGPIQFWAYDNGIVNFKESGAARVSVIGLMFVSFLMVLKVPGAVITSIVLTTFCGINYGLGKHVGDGNSSADNAVTHLKTFFDGPAWTPDMSKIVSGKLTFKDANKPIFWEVVWTFLFVELFDSFGTILGTLQRAKLFKEGPEGMAMVNRAMGIDGFGLSLGAIIGSNSITCYIESNTGIEAGARTGFASFITGACFLLSLAFLAPFVGIIPDAATACALIIVGVLSMEGVKDINWGDFQQAFCGFITIASMGFTYSIANGICAGFIFHTWLQFVKWGSSNLAVRFNRPAWVMPKEETELPHPLMVVMAIFMVCRFAFLGA